MCKKLCSLKTADLHTKKKNTKTQHNPYGCTIVWTWFYFKTIFDHDHLHDNWKLNVSLQYKSSKHPWNRILQKWKSVNSTFKFLIYSETKRAQVYIFEVSWRNKETKEITTWSVVVSGHQMSATVQYQKLRNNEMRFYYDDLSPIHRALTML